MSYTTINFKTKKALKEAVAKYIARLANETEGSILPPVTAYNPSVGGDLSNHTGRVYLKGPHYPQPHKWYAQAEMINGKIVKVS